MLPIYASQNIIRVIKLRMTWVGHVAGMRQARNACKILIGKPEGKRPRGRTRRRCKDNVRINLRLIVWEGVDCTHLTQDRDQWRALVNTVMNLRVS
jgi:hypothetical protein